MGEIVETIKMEQAANATTWKTLVATPGNRKRLFIVVCLGAFAQWNGIGVVSYYLTLVLDTVGVTDTFDQTLINGLLQIFNFAAALSAAFVVDRLGRRVLFTWSGIGMLVSYIVWTACSAVNNETGSKPAGVVVIVCLFTFFFHYDICYTPLLMSYSTEILPFSLRYEQTLPFKQRRWLTAYPDPRACPASCFPSTARSSSPRSSTQSV